MSSSGTLAPNRQNTASPKYNDDISLLISQYLLSACIVRRCWDVGRIKRIIVYLSTDRMDSKTGVQAVLYYRGVGQTLQGQIVSELKIGVTDGGNGGQPACPGTWKKCRKKNMNSNTNVLYIHVCPVSCNVVVMFACTLVRSHLDSRRRWGET